MHVAYVIAPGGGPEANVKTIAPELEKRGHRVSVIYTAASDSVDSSWSQSIGFRFAQAASLHYYVAKLVGNYHAWPLRIRAREQAHAVKNALEEIEREDHIDVVEVTEGFSVSRLGFAWPIVVRAHGSDWTFREFCGGRNASEDRWLRTGQRRHFRQVDSASALSTHLSDHLREALRLSSPIDVIPYGIDTDAFSPNGNKSISRPVLLNVGRLERRKGVDVLLRAMTKVWQRFPAAEVRLVGREADLTHEDLLKLVPAEKRDQIVFPGFLNREELVKEYQAATLYVAPTQYETFGYTVLEAMACARPVISTRVGAIPELVEHEKTGLLVPWDSEEELAEAILELLGNPQQAAAMGAAGRARACESFSLDTIVDRNLEFYRQALAS